MKVDKLLNLMLHSRQKRELPFWMGEITAVLTPTTGAGLDTGAGAVVVAFSEKWNDPTVCLRTSGTGDTGGAPEGEIDRGEVADGESPPDEGVLLTVGETGEDVLLFSCPLTSSLWTFGRTWMFGLWETLADPGPVSLGLGLECSSASGGCWTVTRRLWTILKCSIRSHVIGLLGQYGHTLIREAVPETVTPVPGAGAWVVLTAEL